MAIDLVDDPVELAFDVIKRELEAGRKFTNQQKDLGIRLSIDALAPHERPWFFEIAQQINRIPLWQALWGQFRRCQEWGNANSPLLDPGWANEASMDPEYGLGERPCEECGEVFKPKWQGERFHNNWCGAAEDRRKLEKQRAEDRAVPTALTDAVNLPDEDRPFSIPQAVAVAQMITYGRLVSNLPPSTLPHERLTQFAEPGDDSESLQLPDDFAETEKD